MHPRTVPCAQKLFDTLLLFDYFVNFVQNWKHFLTKNDNTLILSKLGLLESYSLRLTMRLSSMGCLCVYKDDDLLSRKRFSWFCLGKSQS
jgi:hypothetical protein